MLTEEDLATKKLEATAACTPLLLQLGSDVCERCPAFHTAIAQLGNEYRFTWYYCDAHHQDTDLPEALEVTKLPAFLLYTPGSTSDYVVANASIKDLTEAVRDGCLPVFTQDADF